MATDENKNDGVATDSAPAADSVIAYQHCTYAEIKCPHCKTDIRCSRYEVGDPVGCLGCGAHLRIKQVVPYYPPNTNSAEQ